MAMSLDKTHPHHKKSAATWARLQAAYTGQGIEQYLRRHPVEGPQDFIDRKAAAVYRNFPGLTTDLWAGKLLKKKPARVLPDQLAPLVPDVDRLGTPAGPFFKALIEDAMTYGLAFALVDAPKLPEGTDLEKLSMAQAQALNLRPYVVPLSPSEVLDWAFNPDGSLAWVAVREWIMPPALPFTEGKPEPAVKVWHSETWEVWVADKRGKLEPVDHGTHPFGEVPLVPWYAEKAGPFMGKSPLAGIVELSLELLNVNSLLGMALGHASLPRLAIKSSGASGGGVPLPSQRTAGIELDPGDDAKYLYLPSDAVKALQIEADRLKADIKAMVYRQLDQRKESAQPQAAEKTRLDLGALHATLAGWAANFEDAEQKTWQLMARGFTNCDPGQVQITYNKKFDLRTNAERLQEALEAEALDLPSPTFRTEYRTQLVSALLEDSSPEQVAAAVAELADAEGA